jgi:PiT family inorganic phosphate transporter
MTEHTPAAAAATPEIPALRLIRFGLAVLFMVAAVLFSYWRFGDVSLTLVVATAFGAYMAMNIGANDVANNVGPAVGARAITMFWAIVIAAVFEAMGAIIAGGDVVTTIKGGIIDPSRVDDPQTFVWLMMAALLSAALWLNLATMMGAPVSTTHSIVGGVLGAGVAAVDWNIANWNTMGQIAMSWVISPVFGGVIAAMILYAIKRTITYQGDLMEAARRMVPVLLGFMAWAFATYLLLKGLNQIIKVSFVVALVNGAVAGILIYLYTRQRVAQKSEWLSNDREGVNRLFTIPLMFAAALLSFAHGSNDVANAVGPLAAIYDSLTHAAVGGSKAAVPMWILVLGALGLSIGLALYGPRLIRTVGSEITEIDPMRAYSIAMAAAITVIIASQLGLPISTTHVALGAVFGVGFLREYLKVNYERIIEEIKQHHLDQASGHDAVEAFLEAFEAAPMTEKSRMIKALKEQTKLGQTYISKRERKDLRKVHRKNLVKRSVLMRVIAAWIITVPASAIMAAVIYYAIRGAMLP